MAEASAAASAADGGDFCPYVGLQPFAVKDRDYFFGREKEQRVIAANLFAAPLTVLYGPSAVGKSSVLQAGVVAQLFTEPRTAVIYFGAWQGPNYQAELRAECRRAIEAVTKTRLDIDDALSFDEWIVASLTIFRGTLLLMLDQFEEYLLYHKEEDDTSFDAQLARIVNRPDVPTNVLIGLRDDSLSKLNRFSKRIPSLLGNTLELRRLTPEAARRAITGPVEQYNKQFPNGRRTSVEDALVSAVIADVQIEKISPSVSGGLGGVHASGDRGLIETAFLQLVLTELWTAASARAGDRVLDTATLHSLGGADAIVRRHVDREMNRLSDDEQATAAKLFQHLVTPSGAKYAMLTTDLVAIAERPDAEVIPILKALTKARLLRRIESSDRYEIFHDAFASALLDWRKDYHLERARKEAVLEAERQQIEERKEAGRRRRRLILIATVVVVALGVASYLIKERLDSNALSRKNDELTFRVKIAEEGLTKATWTKDAIDTANAHADQVEILSQRNLATEKLRSQTELARLTGNTAKANALALEQQASQASADQAQAEAAKLAEQSRASLEAANATQGRIDDLVKQAQQKGIDLSGTSTGTATLNPPPKLTVGNVSVVVADATGAALPGVTVSMMGAGTSSAITDASGHAQLVNLALGTYTVSAKLAGFMDYSREGIVVTGGLTVSVAATMRAAGDYHDTFKKAMTAIGSKHWKDAQALLETALRQKPQDSGEQIHLSGFNDFESYFPHYYLGVVLRNQNDCAGALKQFDLSEKDGAIQKSDMFKSLRQNRDACGKK